MRWALGLSALFLIVFTAVLVQFSNARNDLAGTSQKFVVHEWGTFTSFSGSDGVKLEFRPLVDNDLPSFILDRESQAQHTLFKGFLNGRQNSKSRMSVLQRMETPVTYFYTDVPRQISVRVGFPQGLLTEFYPPVEKMLPAFQSNDTEKMTNSELDWGSIWLIPEKNFQIDVPETELASELQTLLPKRVLPGVLPGSPFIREPVNPYMHARETDSAIVYKDRSFEKFLFYRGVGNFSLPLTLTAQPDDQFELTNHGEESVRSLFLVTVQGDQLWFKQYSEIQPQQKLAMKQASLAASLSDLASAMETALIEQGLYPKEALAMVNTWRTSWFGEEGTRLFYILPQTKTEELLPLTVKPAPDEVLRVMVGRLEIMRPEDEELVWGIVTESMQTRKEHSLKQNEQPDSSSAMSVTKPHELPPALLKLGRLAEPALVRVKNINSDPKLQAEANLLLEEIRAYRVQVENAEL